MFVVYGCVLMVVYCFVDVVVGMMEMWLECEINCWWLVMALGSGKMIFV